VKRTTIYACSSSPNHPNMIHLTGTLAPTMWMTCLCSVHQHCPPSMTAPYVRKIISIFSNICITPTDLLTEGTFCLCIINTGGRTENTFLFWYKPKMALPCAGLYYTGYVVKASHLQEC
jgi:hypothetical protein